MASIVDIIDSIYPASNSVGGILSAPIFVVFDREIDENSINEGNFFVEGQDTDTFLGPGLSFTLPNVSDSGSGDQLASPGYKGIIKGAITFERIQNTSADIYSGFDTSGTGNIWRTKAIFTPTNALQKLTKYTVYLSGDEDSSDGISTGIRARSIFDPIKGSNIGNGNVAFVGTYTGAGLTDTFNLKITTAGAASEAWFIWWKGSDTSLIFGPIRTEQIQNTLLEDGISVDWQEGDFEVNDTFSVVVKKPELFTGNTYWSFDTGSGTISSIPDSASTSVIGDISTPSISPGSVLVVNSITPVDQATNQPLTTNRITIEFSNIIDPNTITADTIKVEGLPVNGDENIFSPRQLYKDITVSGKFVTLDI